ncbi:MAG TPA: hypothetical protein VHM19_21720 [Polyangiales bacterium]|nr:hypothetical protein [Polyangiales bacterium]
MSWIAAAAVSGGMGCPASHRKSSSGGAGASGSDPFGNGPADAALPDIDASGHYLRFEDRPCPPGNELTYESFGGPFLLNNCQGCHASTVTGTRRNGAPVGVSFDDIEAIRTLRKKIWQMAADDNTRMPPVGKIDPAQRVLLGEWLACGAKTRDDLTK